MCSSWGSSHLPWSSWGRFQPPRLRWGNLGRNKGTFSFAQPGFGLGWERSRIPLTPRVCSFFGLKQTPVCAQRQHVLCLVFPGLCHHQAASSWSSSMCCSSDCVQRDLRGKEKWQKAPELKKERIPVTAESGTGPPAGRDRIQGCHSPSGISHPAVPCGCRARPLPVATAVLCQALCTSPACLEGGFFSLRNLLLKS